MSPSLPAELLNALPTPTAGAPGDVAVNLAALQGDLEAVAREAAAAKSAGLDFAQAVAHPDFPELMGFHLAMRDALLVEIPEELAVWVKPLATGVHRDAKQSDALLALQRLLVTNAQESAQSSGAPELPGALAEFLLFESIRLRLLISAWSSPDFEALGGEEEDIDALAAEELETWLNEPMLADPSIRPLVVIAASASVSLHRDVQERVEALRQVGEDERERLRMRAKLRAALRELRLTESVLLENALAGLLDTERVELSDLQANRPLALAGMSRQAMDQRVSRGRKALARNREHWPARRTPALFDLLRRNGQDSAPVES